jgi:hypothetical protein
MPFTVQELDNIANAALDFHIKGKVHQQSIQEKPLMRELTRKKKMFPGGKGKITKRIQGDFNEGITGFSHDDQVGFDNPANMKQAEYTWAEIHKGISMTLTELKHDGVSVVNSMTGEKTASHDQREMTALADILENKLGDLSEGWSRGLNLMYWRDGSQDAKLAPGVASIVLNDPTSATVVGGIDQQANTWWRNRASLNISVTTPADLAIINALQTERRQLRRFGGKPTMAFCGSAFLDALEAEVRAKGTFTDKGWSREQTVDVGLADLELKDIKFFYDPTLDDESKEKYCYVLDTNHLRPYCMTGEVDKQHAPARPEDRYVIYRSLTTTVGLVCWQRNCQGVYTIV